MVESPRGQQWVSLYPVSVSEVSKAEGWAWGPLEFPGEQGPALPQPYLAPRTIDMGGPSCGPWG